MTQSIEPHQIEWLERDVIAGQRLKDFRRRGQSRLLALINSGGERIERRFFFRQDTVDDEELLIEANRRQFRMGARRLAQGRVLGARDENQTGALRVGQGLHRSVILRALLFQSGKWAEARRIAFPFFKKAAPRPGELQQTDGVPGWGRVEKDVVVIGGESG